MSPHGAGYHPSSASSPTGGRGSSGGRVPRPNFLPETSYSKRLTHQGIEADPNSVYGLFLDLSLFELRLRLGKPRGRLCTFGVNLPNIQLAAGSILPPPTTSPTASSSMSSGRVGPGGFPRRSTSSEPGSAEFFYEKWKL
ncbi:unnamed protein product, partial [Amoebophrya sp. A25]|eukprot:GSA25T00003847001.1